VSFSARKHPLISLILLGIIAYCISEIPNYQINQNRIKLRNLFLAGKYKELRHFSNELAGQSVYKNDILDWEGRLLLEEKRYTEAVKIFEELAKQYPDRYPWWIGYNRIALARAYFGAGRKDDARKELDAAMLMTEVPQVVYYARASAFEMGFLQTSGTRSSEDDSPAPDIIPAELWTLYKEDRLSQLNDRAQMLQSQPQFSDAINHLRGRILVENWEFSRAVPYLEPLASETVRSDWLRGYSGLFLARALFCSNRREEARKALESVLKITSLPGLTKEARNLMVRSGFSPEFQTWFNIESQNLVCHFSPAFTESERTRFVADHEQAFSEIQKVFIASMPRKLDIYVWDTREEAALMGLPLLSFARGDLCSVYLHRHASIGHEMTHVICRYGPKSLARNHFLMEGTAVCFDFTGENKLEYAAANILKKGMPVPTVEQLWRSMQGTSDLVSYPFAGCFIRRLIDSFGIARFRELFQTTGNWEEAERLYGPGLLSLINDFQLDLAGEIARQKAE